jgi:hypothetical protein
MEPRSASTLSRMKRRLSALGALRVSSASTKIASACIGWRRSWLAAAKMRARCAAICATWSSWRDRASARRAFSKPFSMERTISRFCLRA